MKLDDLDRVIIGGWQLSEGHTSRPVSGMRALEAYYEAGFRVFDCADIYTGVEELLGDFIEAHRLGPDDIRVHTKYVPDLAALPTLTEDQTRQSIDRSRGRLGIEKLDLVQFHWWDYEVPGWLDALDTLSRLRSEGVIAEIGLTNFDAAHLAEIVAHGVPVASIQSQYSVLDRRPRDELAALAVRHDVALLCYGSVAGGLLSDRYLGRERPEPPYENRSLAKYMLIVDELGTWSDFQAVLRVLRDIADEKEADIASVASAWCLSQEAARACIVGVRNTSHLAEHVALRERISLTERDLERIERVRRALGEVPGAVYELERDVHGKHAKVMKFNLNTGRE